MTPRIMRNNVIPEHMTSFTVPFIKRALFVVMSMSRLGNPASNRQAVNTIKMGKTCFIMCLNR